MPAPRNAYVDTSVFGGAEDEEFREATLQFLDQVKQGHYVLLVSTLTVRELAGAPPKVRKVFTDLPSGSVVQVSAGTEDEADKLAGAYIAAGVLGESHRDDATHVAIASVVRAGLILSWNFRHIVNYQRIHGFNRVNATMGYPPIEIHSPLEVIYGDHDQKEDV